MLAGHALDCHGRPLPRDLSRIAACGVRRLVTLRRSFVAVKDCRPRRTLMNTKYCLSIFGLCLSVLPAASAAFAQAGNYPDKPVTIIADAAPGATPDVDARFVAEG